MSSKLIKCTIDIGQTFIMIEGKVNEDCEVRVNGALNQNELAAVNCISEVLRCLKCDRQIDTHFNPTVKRGEEGVIVKCEWLRSGKLVVREENPSRKYEHANTIEEALARSRSFTCLKSLMLAMPFNRPVQPKPAKKISTVKEMT